MLGVSMASTGLIYMQFQYFYNLNVVEIKHVADALNNVVVSQVGGMG
jgi:hypothetical protein